MGLSIEVGYLADMLENDEEGAQWFRETIEQLNRLLVSRGLKPHSEPSNCPVWSADVGGYSTLHTLRRLAAHLNLRGALPEPGGDDASSDPVIQEYYDLHNAPAQLAVTRHSGGAATRREYDHLCIHSDCEGFYLPQDFPDVLIAPQESEIPGDMVGSSARLLDETRKLARAIGLPLDIDPESDEVWQAWESTGQHETGWKKYGRESFACLRLHAAARHSIEHGAAIVFT